VQCDLTRPGCSRCAKLGRICPGYRQESDLVFRNKDAKAFEGRPDIGRLEGQRQVERTVSPEDEDGPSRSPSGTVASVEPYTKQESFEIPLALYYVGGYPLVRPDTARSNFSNNSGKASPVLPYYGENAYVISELLPLSAPLQDHWENHSIPLLFSQFSASVGGSRFFGYLDFLPDLYKDVNKGSCLMLATNAFIRTYLCNQTAFINNREEDYGKALRSTNQALQSPSESIQDATLMAIWLLSIREVRGSVRRRVQPLAKTVDTIATGRSSQGPTILAAQGLAYPHAGPHYLAPSQRPPPVRYQERKKYFLADVQQHCSLPILSVDSHVPLFV